MKIILLENGKTDDFTFVNVFEMDIHTLMKLYKNLYFYGCLLKHVVDQNHPKGAFLTFIYI